MAGVLPSNVSYFMQRLQGVSTSHFKVHPQTDGNQTSGKIVRFELPSNTLLSLPATRLFFNCKTAGAGTSMANDVSSFIERCSVYMGGVLVQNGFSGYHVLKHCKSALQGSKCGSTLGHPEIVRAVSYHNGATFGDTDPEEYSINGTESFCIDNWEGLLGSLQPSIIDTGLFPQITLELTLADDTVCPISEGRLIPDGTGATANNFDKTGSGNPTYTLSQMTLQCEVLGMATSVLDQIVEQRIASVGYLSMPFKNYYSFTSTHVDTSRFNVNSASWDRLWLAYRPTTYSAKSAPVIVNGYKKGGFFGDDAVGQTAADIDIGRPQYDIGGVFDTNKERYISNYFKFKEIKSNASNPAYFQLQVNSANIPAYRMTTPEAYAMSMNSLDTYDKNHKMTLDQYKNDFFVQCYRFCLPESDYNRLASGIDTRSVSAMGSLTTENIASCNLMMIAECTAELRLGKKRFRDYD
tara:strand:+ start:195 stop:1592 length:1398 start_codon:yes stop_codon:yes gene_type:complete